MGSPNLLVANMAARTKALRLGVFTTVFCHTTIRCASLRDPHARYDLRRAGLTSRSVAERCALEQQGWGVERSQTAEMFETAYDLVYRFFTEEAVESYDTRGRRPRRHRPRSGAEAAPALLAHCGELYVVLSRRAPRDERRDRVPFERRAHRDGGELPRRLRSGRSPIPGAGRACGHASSHHIYVGETAAECEQYARPNLEGWMEHFLRIISDRPVDGEDPS